MKNRFHRYLNLPFEIKKPDNFPLGEKDYHDFLISSYKDQVLGG